MESSTTLLVITIIGGVLLLCTLIFTLYIVLCEYYELKFHYMKPKKGLANKLSGLSSSTVGTGEISSGLAASRSGGANGSHGTSVKTGKESGT